MDWERKFYDIVRETETNLENARRKLHGHDAANPTSSHSESIERKASPHSSSLSPTPSHSFPSAATWMSYVNNNDHINAIRRHLGQSSPRPSPSPTPTPAPVPPCTPTSTLQVDAFSSPLSPPFGNQLRELQTRMESQAQTIDSLQQLVMSLTKERDQYRRQINHLQNEVGHLNSRLPSKDSDIDPELRSQVERVRQEVRADLQRLEKVVDSGRQGTQYSADLERSFNTMQKSMHSELEELRRDLNSMIHRVGKLELDTPTHIPSHRHVQSRQSCKTDRMAPGSSVFSAQSGPAAGDILHTLSPPLSATEMFQVRDLRNTVSELHNKLDSLEGRVTSASQQPFSSTLSSLASSHVPRQQLSSLSSLSSIPAAMISKYSENPSTSLLLPPPTSTNTKVTFQDDLHSQGHHLRNDLEDDDDLDLFNNDFDLDLDLDRPFNGDQELSDELEEIVNVDEMLSGKGKKAKRKNLTLSDDFDDDVDDFGLGPSSVGAGRSVGRWEERGGDVLETPVSRGREGMTGLLPRLSSSYGKNGRERADKVGDFNIGLLNLDTSIATDDDPFDLDSLENVSGENLELADL